MKDNTRLRQKIASRFEIRMTEHGLVPVTMEFHLAILKELGDSYKSLAEIKKALPGYPVSTLFKQLDTMIGAGLIEKDTEDGTLYRVSSHVMQSTSIIASYNHDIKSRMIHALTESKDSYMRRMNNVTILQWNLEGINTHMLFRKFGSIIALVYKKTFESNTVEELIMKVSEFTRDKGMPRVIPYSFSPLKVLVEYDTPLMDQNEDSVSMVTGLILEVLRGNGFGNYEVTNIVMMDNNLKVQLKIERSAKESVEYDFLGTYIDENDYPFTVLTSDVGKIIVPDADQMRIIEHLDTGTKCVQELMDLTGRVRSSVVKDLEELIEGKVVGTQKTATGGIYYHLNARIVLYKNACATNEYVKDVINYIMTRRSDIYDILYYYLALVFSGSGIDNNRFWNYLGESFSDLVMDVEDGDKERSEQIIMICMNMEGSEMKIVKEMPFTVRFRSGKKDTTHGVNQFFASALCRLIEHDTGRKVYRIIKMDQDDEYYIDEVEHMFDEVRLTKSD